MAYLTDYSYRQLIERIEIENLDRIDQQFFKTNIFDNDYLYYLFNQLDLKKLLTEKVILSGDERFALAYKEVPTRKDNLTFVLEIKGQVKYHKNNQCKALGRGFKNFYMPESVVRLEEADPNKHEELVKDIRNWFGANNYTVERHEKNEITDEILTTSFNDIFPKKYNIEPITLSTVHENQFKWYISRKSKGNVETEELFDQDSFIIKITEILKRRDHICNGKTLQSLSKYDFLVSRDPDEISEYIDEKIKKGYLKNVDEVFIDNYGIEKLQKFWREHREIKSEAYRLLTDFFKWTYNYKNKVFDEVFLDDFNLGPCSLCYNPSRIAFKDVL